MRGTQRRPLFDDFMQAGLPNPMNQIVATSDFVTLYHILVLWEGMGVCWVPFSLQMTAVYTVVGSCRLSPLTGGRSGHSCPWIQHLPPH